MLEPRLKVIEKYKVSEDQHKTIIWSMPISQLNVK